MSATTNRDDKADAALALLCQRWPKCFFIFPGRRLPLKIGIHKDIPEGLIEPKVLRLAFRLYVNNPGYLNAMRLGAARVDLNGEVAGTVDENDAKSAQARLNWIRIQEGATSRRSCAGSAAICTFTFSTITANTTITITRQPEHAARGGETAPGCGMIASNKDKFSDAAKAFDATMAPRPLDRAGQRRLARAMLKDARRGVGWAEDSAFFKANPTRNYRMRLATANEIAVFDSAEGTQAGADGCWWLVVVRQFAPGERAMTRIYAPPPPPWPLTETSERLAQVVFESNVGWQS